VEPEIESRTVPEAPWEWTDDTAMALSVFEHIRDQGVVDRDRLAGMFGRRYAEDPRRGYGAIAQSILTAITSGTHWRKAAGAVFEGQGSRGNGETCTCFSGAHTQAPGWDRRCGRSCSSHGRRLEDAWRGA
jgi:ADP-ribosylglycohydrolase